MLVRHLRSLDPASLARMVYEEQKKKGWPGLVKETTLICQKLNIPNCNEDNIFNVGSKGYRKQIVLKCKEKDEKELRTLADKKTKCEKIMADKYGRKLYMSANILRNVRQIFYTRVKMQPFAGNYPNDGRFLKTNGLCRCRLKKEDEIHLVKGKCTVYQDLRTKYPDLEDDYQLTKYFEAVLERRGTLEDKDKRKEESRVVGQPLIAARHSVSRQ